MSITGQAFKTRLLKELNEYQSGYYDDDRLQPAVDEATSDVFEKCIAQFERDSIITNDLQPFVIPLDIVPGAGNIIDISPTSSDVPNYRVFQSGKTTFTVSGQVITGQLTPLKQANFGAFFGQGTYDYPKYQIMEGQFFITPASPICTTVAFRYVRTYVQIDLTDNTDPIPYTESMIQKIILITTNRLLFESRDREGQGMNTQNMVINKAE